MTRTIAYLSGAPRVSTKASAAASGARQHILGAIDGFRASGWLVQEYIVGDKVPEAWLQGATERALAKSWIKRFTADTVRIILSIFHTFLALRTISDPTWVYERCGAFQMMGYFFQRRGKPWILETNYLMFEELTQDRKSVALTSIVRWIEQFAYRKCDLLVVVSSDLKDTIVTKLGIVADKIIIVPNAADIETFNPANCSRRRLFEDRSFVVGFQGSMYKWAGLDNLLQAIAFLRKEQVDIAAVLLGDGHERRALELLSHELGIQNFVQFPGLVERREVPSYIAGYDIGYSGQINLEGNSMYLSPLKLYDYMAMGKPVIASRFADAVTLTKNGTIGYLFSPGDLDDLICALRKAVDERQNLQTMGEAARAEVITKHSWATRIRDFSRVAESMLGEPMRFQ